MSVEAFTILKINLKIYFLKIFIFKVTINLVVRVILQMKNVFLALISLKFSFHITTTQIPIMKRTVARELTIPSSRNYVVYITLSSFLGKNMAEIMLSDQFLFNKILGVSGKGS